MSDNVAPGTNKIRLQTLHLCTLVFDSLPEHKEGAEGGTDTKKTWFELFAEGMRLEVLENAYVLVLRTSDGESSIPPSMDDAIFARTNKDGELLRIEESEIDAQPPAPVEAPHLLGFRPEETFAYFWSYSKSAFRTVVAEARKDLDAAMQRFDFASVIVQDHYSFTDKMADSGSMKDNPFELLSKVSRPRDRLSLIREYLMRRFSTGVYRGYYVGWVIQQWHKDRNHWIEPYSSWLIAGSSVIDALYLAELVRYHALSLPQQHVVDWTLFGQAEDVVLKSAAGELPPELKKGTEEFRLYGKSWKMEYGPEYREYAYQCGRAKVPRKLFTTAVDVRFSSDGWWDAAQKIEATYTTEDGNPIEPRTDPSRRHHAPLFPIMRVFDFYRFGAVFETSGWWDSFCEAQEKLEAAGDRVRAAVMSFMERHLSYRDFLIHLEMRYPADPKLRIELHRRYLDIAAWTCFAWWEKFDPDDPYLGKFSDWIGGLADKMGSLMGEYFQQIENIQDLMHQLGSNQKKIEQFLSKMELWNGKYRGPTSELSLEGTKLTFDVRLNKKVVVLKGVTSEGDKVAMELEFVRESVPKRVKKKIRMTGGKTKRWKKPKFSRVEKVVYEMESRVIPPKFHSTGAWPKWLGAAGDSLSLAISAEELIQEMKKKSDGEIGDVLVKVARDTFQVVDSASDALVSGFRWSERLLGVQSKLRTFGKFAKGPGLFLEAYINFKDGATILMLEEDSEAAQATYDEDEFVGYAQTMKGVVLVGGTAAGVGMGLVAGGAVLAAGGGVVAAWGAALPPLGFALAVTGILVIGIEIAIYLHYGPENIMEDLEKELGKANEREFGRRFLDPDKPTRFRTPDLLDRFAGNAETILA